MDKCEPKGCLAEKTFDFGPDTELLHWSTKTECTDVATPLKGFDDPEDWGCEPSSSEENP